MAADQADGPDQKSSQNGRAPRKPVPIKAIQAAVEIFEQLTQQPAERVTGVRSTEDGWSVLVDVIDVDRIPSTMSVLATYRLDIDGDGELLGYERLRRFARSATDNS
ncbi:MAG: hypothetical protein QOK10_2544 [Pseudonocardiales bacterium]|jgi:hypothetical protein|nr:hypothetical protein [Pseudonocardiales bacterium]